MSCERENKRDKLRDKSQNFKELISGIWDIIRQVLSVCFPMCAVS